MNCTALPDCLADVGWFHHWSPPRPWDLLSLLLAQGQAAGLSWGWRRGQAALALTPPDPSQTPAPLSSLATLGESGSPHRAAITFLLTTRACGQGIQHTTPCCFQKIQGCAECPSPPNHSSQLGRHSREERTVTKGKIDPTLSRSLELLTLPSSTLASWEAKGHQGQVKPQLGSSWAGVSVFKAAMVRDTASSNTDRARAIIYTSLYLYIRYRLRSGQGHWALHVPHLHFCSPTHRSSRS